MPLFLVARSWLPVARSCFPAAPCALTGNEEREIKKPLTAENAEGAEIMKYSKYFLVYALYEEKSLRSLRTLR
jgi:hypothetical protein